jgi:hypothetical protein
MRRSQRGTVLVEFAVVAPLLFALLFGIVEFGTAYNDWISLRQGAREAARQGSVANFGSTATCSLTFSGGGAAPSAGMQKLMCMAKRQIGLDASRTRIRVIFADAALQAGGALWNVGNGLIVCAEYRLRSVTGFLTPVLNGRYLRTKTSMRIEQPVSGTETAGFEQDPSGSGWSWCTAANPSP